MPDAAAVPPGPGGAVAAAPASKAGIPPGVLAGARSGGFHGGLPGRLPAMPARPVMPASAPRASLCFARSELGDQQVRCPETVLPLHVARLLLLFEGPQTVEDLRRMIDEPWLPAALIELERRRLVYRLSHLPPPRADPWDVGSGGALLDRRRAVARIMFLRLLGSLGTDMARRIDQCRSDRELDELMPQVDALIEALAGREALGQFRQQTTRSS